MPGNEHLSYTAASVPQQVHDVLERAGLGVL